MGKSLWILQINLTQIIVRKTSVKWLLQNKGALIFIIWRQNFTGLENSFQNLYSYDTEINKIGNKKPTNKPKNIKSEKHFGAFIGIQAKNVSVCL